MSTRELRGNDDSKGKLARTFWECFRLLRRFGELGVESDLHAADHFDEMAFESDGPIIPMFERDSGGLVEQGRPGTPQNPDRPVDADHILERDRDYPALVR